MTPAERSSLGLRAAEDSRADLEVEPRRPGRAAAAAAGGTGAAAAVLSIVLGSLEGRERDVALAVVHALGDPLIAQWPVMAIMLGVGVVALAHARNNKRRWRQQLRLAVRQEQAIEGLRQDLRDGLAGVDARMTRAEGELRAMVTSEVRAATAPLAERVGVLERKRSTRRA